MGRNRRLGPLPSIPPEQMKLLRSLCNEMELPTNPAEQSRNYNRYLTHYRNTLRAATTTAVLGQLDKLPCPKELRSRLENKRVYFRNLEKKARTRTIERSDPQESLRLRFAEDLAGS